jgi:hypothetical protein
MSIHHYLKPSTQLPQSRPFHYKQPKRNRPSSQSHAIPETATLRPLNMSLSPSRTKCSLLALPAEIKTIILTALLCRTEPVELCGREINKLPEIQRAFVRTQTAPGFVFVAPSQRLSFRILRVCAQVYEEGSRLLYGQNNFDLREGNATMME